MNNNTERVIELIKGCEGWVSGEEIGTLLGISRSAVSKHIGLLRKLGYEIDAASHRGYFLKSVPDTACPAEVYPLLKTGSIGRSLLYFSELDSTNTEAVRRAKAGAPEGVVIVADYQDKGQGRLERQWHSPSGVNLYFSMVLRPQVSPGRICQLPLVAASALLKGIRGFVEGVDAAVKWPNDILAGSRKLSGILCLSEAETDVVHYVVVGIGINVNAREFPGNLKGSATSLLLEAGREISRPGLLANVLNEFESDYKLWLGSEDLAPFLEYLENNSVMKGREVTVKNAANEISGRVTGISPEGGLCIKTAKGMVRVMSGDVTVAKW